MSLLHSKKGLLLLILLILFGVSIWAVQTQRLELRKKALIPQPSQCWDRVYEAEGGPVWPDSCRGDISTDTACLQVLTPLTDDEKTQYQAWVLSGKPPIPGCTPEEPICTPLPTECQNNNWQECVATMGVPPGGWCPWPTPTPPPGCHYEYPQCAQPIEGFQAPCDPVLVCTTPACPSPPPCAGPLAYGDPLPGGGCPLYYCPATATPTARHPVSWATPYASLTAEDFKIVAGNKTFYGTPDPGTTFNIHSDGSYTNPNASNPNYTSLEVTWKEQGVEMRLFMYFYKNNQQWWAGEIRTYNGVPYNPSQGQYPDWIYYTDDPYFNSPLGQPYRYSGTFTLQSSSNNTIPGSITLTNLILQAFYPPFNTPTPTVSPTPTLTPTPTPPQVAAPIEFRIKFSGVNDGAAEGAGVTARIVRNDVNVVTPPILFAHVGGGVYKATVGFSGSITLPPGPGYTIILKGEKHVARKFCADGQTTPCSGNQSLTIPSGSLTRIFDFTGLTLDPGDLPPQDGKADTGDFGVIKSMLSKPCSSLTAQDKKTADLDYNGCIDIGDAFLMRKTLETRYDEN